MNIEILSALLHFLHPGKFHECSILDAGCGNGGLSGLIRPFCTYLVGCDVSHKYIKRAKQRGFYDDLILCDVSCLPFRDASFFALIGNQMLEHLPKKKGEVALDKFDKAAKRIFLTLPAKWTWKTQIRKAIERENIYEIHMSKWSIKELKEREYKVRGYGARHPLFLLFGRLTFRFPKLAGGLIAIKEG